MGKNLSLFCLLVSLIAVNCYSVKQDDFDYCNDIGDATFCKDSDKETMCKKGYWKQICWKTRAYKDVWPTCTSGDDLDWYCKHYRNMCMKSCYERDCKSKTTTAENIDEEQIF